LGEKGEYYTTAGWRGGRGLLGTGFGEKGNKSPSHSKGLIRPGHDGKIRDAITFQETLMGTKKVAQNDWAATEREG